VLRVGVDVQASSRNATGTGRYTGQLLASLRRLPTVEPVELIRSSSHRRTRAARLVSDLHWSHYGLARAAASAGVDILHCPAFLGPTGGSCPVVVTVHDTLFRRRPKDYRAWWAAYMRAAVPAVLKRADRIIVGSEAVRTDLIDDFHVDPERVRVVPYGVDHARFRPDEQPTQADGLPPAGYLLYVGALVHRKRVPVLLEALARLRGDGAVDTKLVICGARSPGMPGEEDVYSTVSRLRLEDSVIFVGHVSDELLPQLYRGAAALVSASIYEGFGLTYLEAMACGTPVVTCGGSAISEVVGDAALVLPPAAPAAEIADALAEILQDSKLRYDLIERGVDRARTFTWQRTAQATLAVYMDAATGGRSSVS
jgi:glycosyltransferase involved in cell wall biosynthesis